MAIEIKKPIDRALLKQIIHDFDLHALYETLTNQKIVDVQENYVECNAGDAGALLVIDDSTSTPNVGEVGLSTVTPFISTITAGAYVQHIAEQFHTADVRKEKYARRLGTDLTDEEIEALWNLTPEQLAAFQSLIRDTVISKNYLWSSDKTNTEVQNAISQAKTYTDNAVGSLTTLTIEVVTALPGSPEDPTGIPKENVLYVYNTGSGFPIYIYSSTSGWTQTGADLSSIDLTGYFEKKNIITNTTAATAGKVFDSTTIKSYVDNQHIYSSDQVEPTDQADGCEWLAKYN